MEQGNGGPVTDADDMQAGRHAATQRGRVAGNGETAALIIDVEELIADIDDNSDAQLTQLRERLTSAIAGLREALDDGAGRVRGRARAALAASDRYLRRQPWQAIGVAAVAGLLVGFLVSRR